MRFILLSAVVLAGVAGATPTVTISNGDNTYGAGQTAGYGFSACNSPPTLTWTADAPSAGLLCPSFRVWVSAGSSCATAPDGGELTPVTQSVVQLATGVTGTYTFSTANLDSLGGQLCSAPTQGGIDNAYALCVNEPGPTSNGLTVTCDTITDDQAATPTLLRIDTIPPAAPTLKVSAFDTKATVTITPEVTADYGGADLYYAFFGDGGVSGQQLDAGTFDVTSAPWQHATCTVTSTNCDVTDLTNNQTYVFLAVAYDEADNPSPNSTPVISTVQETYGFFSAYKAAGGQGGGCSSSGASMAVTASGLLALAWFFGRRRG